MKFKFSREIINVYSKINLHEIPSNGIRFIPKILTENQGKNDGLKAAELMIKLTVAAV